MAIERVKLEGVLNARDSIGFFDVDGAYYPGATLMDLQAHYRMSEDISPEDIKEGNVLGSLKNDDVMSRCVYPFNRIVVNPHGFVVACTADFHKKLEIGDTTKNTLTEIWNGEKFQYLRKKHLDNKLDNLFCDKCINNIDCKTTDLNEAFEKNL